MTAFLTSWALTRPRISVRKSSSRSDQRRPPRATRPNRRCTASSRGEYTKISNLGPGPEVVRAQGPLDQGQVGAQDPVVVQGHHVIQLTADLLQQRLAALRLPGLVGGGEAGR